MLPELEQDLLHLEGSRKSLNQHCATDGSVRQANVRLREVEDVVPETGLLVVLHLGKIEVRSEATSDELLGVVEEVESKVEDSSRNGLVVDENTRLLKVPSTGTNERVST